MTAILSFYTEPAAMTSAGRHAALLDALPRDIVGLVRVVQGLELHQHLAFAYGAKLSEARKGESHLRQLERMLDRLLAHDSRPLTAQRPLDSRLVGVCRHFTVFIVAMLRAKGIPARARCGFGTYFNPGTFEDHWVCEYWNAAMSRWVLVDAQLDEVQQKLLRVDFDPLDVPRDRFLVAGDAWKKCRSGTADPAKFGIAIGGLRGLWFVAGNVLRDLAALNNMEMLPWDVWGAMAQPGEPIDADRLALFDRLAALTLSPDENFGELTSLYRKDARLRVPPVVFNALLNRPETLNAA